MADLDSLSSTFSGYVATIDEAQILIECCLRGMIKPIARRLDKSERDRLVKNGSVFIYDEKASNIQRWTDSRSWSPSRARNGGFIYCEMRKPKNKLDKSTEEGLVRMSFVVGVMLSPDVTTRFHVVSYYTLNNTEDLVTPSKKYPDIYPHSAITDGKTLYAHTQSVGHNPANPTANATVASSSDQLNVHNQQFGLLGLKISGSHGIPKNEDQFGSPILFLQSYHREENYIGEFPGTDTEYHMGGNFL